MAAKYKRVLIKLSGEALAQGVTVAEGEKKPIINYEFLKTVCEKIKKCIDLGVEVAIVVGAGNIWRGKEGKNFERVRADHMGMLATVINCLAIQDVLESVGVPTRVMTAIEMKQFAEPYIRNKAVSHLSKKRAVIFGCGLGTPYVSTDTAAVMRAKEIDADVVLLAKNVDAVYTADPKKDPNAVRLVDIDFMEVLKKDLKVMDSTATSFSMENDLPILVFGLDDPENICRAIAGEKIGTFVHT
jgi:uridylate kinase